MISDVVKSFEKWAVENSWNKEPANEPKALPQTVIDRYKNIPADWVNFISCYHSILNNEENMWFLTSDNFIEGTWRYNEFEIMSLEAAEDDEEWTESIKLFWDNNLPVIMSVGGDYQYYAIEISSGKIVQGCEPEFEEVEYVADSFAQFLEKIISGEIQLGI